MQLNADVRHQLESYRQYQAMELMIDNLQELPEEENEFFEFKGSKESLDKLGEKICKAASAFSNAGGGAIILGVGGDGAANGGIPTAYGRTPIRDWIDSKLRGVQPAVKYQIKAFYDCGERGRIEADRAVVVVEFYESGAAPHMSSDHVYYVRAGAHSVPASSFLVEALIAKRGLGKPVLTYLFQRKPRNAEVIQLTLVPLTSAPALNVVLKMNPLSEPLQKAEEMFPLKIPVIDAAHPFAMDVDVASRLYNSDLRRTTIEVEYYGIDGKEYSLVESVDAFESIPPLEFSEQDGAIEKALKQIARSVK